MMLFALWRAIRKGAGLSGRPRIILPAPERLPSLSISRSGSAIVIS